MVATTRLKMGRKKLTREEMWEAITGKYPSLNVFSINCRYKQYDQYKNREELFKIIINIKLHKSRHLKKAQKMKVEYELNLKVLEKL